jgi:hypothetical protein
MSTPKNVIRVPKVPEGSFDKGRAVSVLLQTQVTHMAEAVRIHLDEATKSIKTEGEAAACLEKMARILRLLAGED